MTEKEEDIIELTRMADGSFAEDRPPWYRRWMDRGKLRLRERFPMALMVRELTKGSKLSPSTVKQMISLVLLGRVLMTFRRVGLRGAGGLPLTALSLVMDVWLAQRAKQKDPEQK